MRLVALLPMKAHSERVPAKNFRDFLGKPLFRWTLDTLLSFDAVDQVVINTDAAALLEQAGLPDDSRVVLRDRKPDLCGDFVSMNAIIADDIAAINADAYVQTHTTNPLLRAETLRAAYAAFAAAHGAGEADSLYAVTRHQARFYWPDGRPVNHDPANLKRTQDLDPMYEENSNFYFFTRDSFAATQARIGVKALLHEVDRLEATDIDDQETWDLAEAVARMRGYA